MKKPKRWKIHEFDLTGFDDQKKDPDYYEKAAEFVNSDKIDYRSLYANYIIFMAYHNPKKIENAKGYPGVNLDNFLSPSIHEFESIFSLVRGYPQWFLLAYPDVVYWAKNLSDKKLAKVLGIKDMNDDKGASDIVDDDEQLKLSSLRKVVDTFKKERELEASFKE